MIIKLLFCVPVNEQAPSTTTTRTTTTTTITTSRTIPTTTTTSSRLINYGNISIPTDTDNAGVFNVSTATMTSQQSSASTGESDYMT